MAAAPHRTAAAVRRLLSFAALQDTQRLLVQHGGAAACAPRHATPCAPRPTDVADGAGRGAAKARSARPGDPPTCTDSFTSKLAPPPCAKAPQLTTVHQPRYTLF